MYIVEKLKLKYHMSKIVKAIKKGDKDKYDKHATILNDMLWDVAMRAK